MNHVWNMKSYNVQYQNYCKEIFKDVELYNNVDVINEFARLGCIDISYSNDLCPSFEIKIKNKQYQIMLANSIINDMENELFNETIIRQIFDNGELSSPIHLSVDIWEIWIIIKSNIRDN